LEISWTMFGNQLNMRSTIINIVVKPFCCTLTKGIFGGASPRVSHCLSICLCRFLSFVDSRLIFYPFGAAGIVWVFLVLGGAVWCSLCGTYPVVLCGALWCSVVLCDAPLWCTVVLWGDLWWSVVLCCALWCSVVRCAVLWCSVVLCRAL
jgi:hypothetical protein